jgi:hypothetical protein
MNARARRSAPSSVSHAHKGKGSKASQSLTSSQRRDGSEAQPTATQLTIYPYWLQDCWVFDDERTRLKEEAFVLGISEMITRAVEAKAIPKAKKGFALTFSSDPFEGYDVHITHVPQSQIWESGLGSIKAGDWYEGDVFGEHMVGWLCPALTLYFRTAPANLYLKCTPLPAGVNPIWTPPPGARTRQFVSASTGPVQGTTTAAKAPRGKKPARTTKGKRR